jgi:uncharacterized membrane protein YebE (DUF533 family)
MSLMKTLAKVAVGVAIAKGAQHMTRSRGGAGSMLSQLGQRAGGTSAAGAGGGLGALLGGGGTGGGLGSLLEGLGSGTGGGGSATGLAGMLGGGTGGGGGGAAGLAGMLGGGGAAGALGALLGGGGGGSGSEPAFGQRLNQALATGAEPETEPTPDEEAVAGMMVRAMLMAAKADGRIDQGERDALLGQLDDLSPEEQRFVQDALDDPIDVDAFAREVPDDPGLRMQIYAAGLSAIDLDTQAEADFLNAFARALGLSGDAQARVHQAMSGGMG